MESVGDPSGQKDLSEAQILSKDIIKGMQKWVWSYV